MFLDGHGDKIACSVRKIHNCVPGAFLLEAHTNAHRYKSTNMNRAIVLLALSAHCLAQINDHDALVAIGNQLNWKGWKNNKNWMSSQNHCTWYGVVCDSNMYGWPQIRINQ